MRNYLLLTPGPLSTSETVRQAMLQDWCTWDADYNEGIVQDIRSKLLSLAHLGDDYTTVLMQGSGTYSVEATLGSVVRPEDKLLIISNGAYGKRMADIARRLDLNFVLVSLHETRQITSEIVIRALAEYPDITHLAMVHCETTTGILNPIEDVARILRNENITFIVDAMSSFGGIPIDIRELGIDFLVSSSNKCIQGVPGFGFIIARTDKLKECEGVSRSLSLDIYDQWKEMEKGNGKWRFTSPTHVVRAFHQALIELEDEGGIAARYERYRHSHHILVEGMKEIGYEPLLLRSQMSPIITSFLYPGEEFNFQDFYNRLKERGFVIYPGKISNADTFRIGNIGDVHPEDFVKLVEEIARITEENSLLKKAE